MSDCSSLEEGGAGQVPGGPRRNLLTIRLDRRARRLESNNRERRRMHELNAAFQVCLPRYLINLIPYVFSYLTLLLFHHHRMPLAEICVHIY